MVKNNLSAILNRFFIIIFIIGITSALEKQIFKSQWLQEIIFPGDRLFVESNTYPSYAEFTIDEDDNRKVNVSVQSFSNGHRKYGCYFPIQQNQLFPAYQLTSLMNDFEVITYGDQMPSSIDTKIIIVNMKTCELIHKDLTVTNDPTKFNFKYIMTYEDSIDFFYTSACECDNDPCMWRYNTTTNNWSNPLPITVLKDSTLDKPITSISHLSKGTSYLVVLGTGEEQTLALINTSSNKTSSSIKFHSESSPELSSSHDSVGICYASSPSKVNCTRLDADLRTSLSVELELGGEALLAGARNSKDGGMLLLTCYCSKEANYLCTEYQLDLTEIRADGSHEASKEFAKLDCEPLFSRFLFFQEDGDICLRIMCYSDRFQDLKVFNVFVKCF